MRKENNKKFKINVMDVLIILLALICVFSIALRGAHTKETYTADEYRLYFQIDDIRSSSYSFFEGHAGETVRIKSNGEILGSLGDEFVRGSAVYTYTENMEDGTAVNKNALYPASQSVEISSNERCSISGYIVVRGNRSSNSLFLNGETRLVPNQTLTIVTEYIEATIRITSISEK